MLKRVLFVSYTSAWTGPTNSLFLLLKYVIRRYKVAVLLPTEGPFSQALAGEGIPFFTLSLTKGAIPAMVQLIRREGFDLIYGNSNSTCTRNALVTARLVGVPFIGHIREMGWKASWRTMGYLRFAQAVIAVSQACAESISRFVARGRLSVVYNGVQLPDAPESRQVARTRLLSQTALRSEDVILVGVAHICPRKGQVYAVEAMADVIRDVPSARLLLIGSLDRDTSYVEIIHTMIRERGLDRHVFLLGFRDDVLQLLPGADIFVHTALADPHPRSVLEAMGASLPVVTFAVDGVTETVVDRQTGYLAVKGDVSGLAIAARQLAQDETLRTQFGANGQHRVREHFSAQRMAQQVGDIIDATLEGATR